MSGRQVLTGFPVNLLQMDQTRTELLKFEPAVDTVDVVSLIGVSRARLDVKQYTAERVEGELTAVAGGMAAALQLATVQRYCFGIYIILAHLL